MRRYLSIVLLVLASPFCDAASYRLVNAGKQGLQAYTIDRVLRLHDDQIDVGTAALLLSRQWSNEKSVYKYRLKLDGMAVDVLKRLEKKSIRQADARAVAVINEYLYEELGFKSLDTADNPEDLFLHNVIDTRRGYCLGLSVLYLAIGERIGLPLYGVVVPGHFFVRYDDGRSRFNIETTSMGRSAGDDHYIEKFKPPRIEDSLYLKNLTKRQVLGCFFNNLGNSYSAVGEIDNAQAELERAVAINPNLAEAHTNLGNIYLKKGWAIDAVNHYINALQIIDTDPKTHNNLANAYGYLGYFEKAVAEYRVAIRLQPDFVDAYRNLANTYLRQGQFSNALAELRTALRLAPGDVDSILLLGDVYRMMKDYRSAIAQYVRSLQIAPRWPSAHTNLAYCYYETDFFEDAVRHFTEAISLDPSSTGAYFGLALAYDKLGMIEHEIEAYRQLLTVEPAVPAALQNLGNAYVTLKNYNAAVDCYRLAIQYQPDSSGLRYNLGVAYANMESYELAVSAYLDAVRLDPRNASAHNALAVGYYLLKDSAAALQHARIAKELGFSVQKELLDVLEKSQR